MAGCCGHGNEPLGLILNLGAVGYAFVFVCTPDVRGPGVA